MHKISSQATEYLARNRRRRIWMQVVSVLACIVVFCTTYALILPAITMENTICGLAEHVHTEECYESVTATELVCSPETLGIHTHTETCYDEEGKPVCGYADFVVHTHDDSCYDGDGNLICPLPEIEAHTHTEACFAAACDAGLEEQTELSEPAPSKPDLADDPEEQPEVSKADLDGELEEQPEPSELEPGEPAPSEPAPSEPVPSEPVPSEPVPSEPEPSVASLPDNLEEQGEAGEPELICGREEIILHTHEESCFDENGNLTCGKVEIREHQHSDDCFRTVEAKPVLICGLEEHTHTEECIPADTAPAEDTPADTLTEEEQAQVDEVIALIDALPTADEVEGALLAYEDAEDWDGYEAYYSAVGQQGRCVYEMYADLSEEAQTQVNNADRLWDLEWLWSAATLNGSYTSDAPTTVASASTADFIELNLYDYNSAINNNWKSNPMYPGFQWNGGAYMKGSSYDRHKVDYIDFGNSMITDYDYAGSDLGKATTAQDVTGQRSGINNLDISDYGVTNRPIGMSTGAEVLSRTLVNGYPALADGTSLSYLFTSSSAVTKQNTQSIDGLFQQDAMTGEYYYNSRWNHAQYSNNRFTLYNQIITPNFIVYPFGNFLPFNDITDGGNATQVGKIANVGTYVQRTIDDLYYSSGYSSNATKQQLFQMLAKYREDLKSVSTTGGTAWTTWNAANAIKDYFTGDGDHPSDDTSLITGTLLNKMYNIDWDVDANFFFGMDMTMTFLQPKGGMTGNDTNQDGESDYPMVFYFTGDDDVWVYIDDVLFLDLSGIHRHVGGEIDFVNGVVKYYALDSSGTGDVSSTPYKTYTFAELLTAAGKSTDGLNSTGTFKDYTYHKFKFYYMERGSGSSVCRLNFNFPLLRRNSISVTKELSVDEQDKLALLGNPDFRFQVLKAGSSGGLFIGAGVTYNIYDSSDTLIGTGATDANGVFTLKAGQRAEFTGINEDAGKYYVRELLDANAFEQYGKVFVDGTSQTTNYNVTIGSDQFKGLDSTVKDVSDGTTVFHFNNQVTFNKLGSLEITKKLETYPQARTVPTFDFEVTLDGTPLPVGTTYTVGSETRIVETAGIITVPAGATAKISNILAGSQFIVKETTASGSGYTVTYSGSEGVTTDGQSASGTILVNSSVQVTVTNGEKGASVTIPVGKTISNPDDTEHTFSFRLEQVTDETGTSLVEDGTVQEVSIPVTDKAESAFTLTYLEKDLTTPVTFYYKITEISGEGQAVDFDESVYVAGVTVSSTAEGIQAEVTSLWKDGTEVTDGSLQVSFTNTLLRDLTLQKKVSGVQTDTAFTFEVTLQYNNAPLSGTFRMTKSEEAADITFTDGKATVALKADETIMIHGLPYGANWAVRETAADGYRVSWEVGETATDGNTASGTVDGSTIICTNTGTYELPQTGGAGTGLYTMGGALLMAAAGILWHIQRKRRKEEPASS